MYHRLNFIKNDFTSCLVNRLIFFSLTIPLKYLVRIQDIFREFLRVTLMCYLLHQLHLFPYVILKRVCDGQSAKKVITGERYFSIYSRRTGVFNFRISTPSLICKMIRE